MSKKILYFEMLAYAKTSALISLEGLTEEDILWQPGEQLNHIGWHICHLASTDAAFKWQLNDADPIVPEPYIHFGPESKIDEVQNLVPSLQDIITFIHDDWKEVIKRFRKLKSYDFTKTLPQNNVLNETLGEMIQRIAWHTDHHVGKICHIRSLMGKPKFPRPIFSKEARKQLQVSSQTSWEKILLSLDKMK